MNDSVSTVKPGKPRRYSTVIAAAAIVIIVIAGLYFATTRYWLPASLEKEVAAVMSAKLGTPASALTISSAGISAASITVNKNSAAWLDALNITQVTVRYRLTNLLLNRKIKIQEIELSGLRLRFSTDDTGVKLNGEDFSRLTEELKRVNQTETLGEKETIRLNIVDSVLELKTGAGQKTLLLPFNLDMTWYSATGVIQAELDINWQRHVHNFKSRIDLNIRQAEIKFNSTLPLENIRHFMDTLHNSEKTFPLKISGSGKYSGQMLLDYAARQIKSIEFDGRFDYAAVSYGNFTIGSYRENPLEVRLIKSGAVYALTAKGAFITAPALLSLEQFTGEIDFAADKITLNSGVKLMPEAVTGQISGKTITGKLPLQNARFNATYHLATQHWELALNNKQSIAAPDDNESRQLLLKYGDLLLNGTIEKLEMFGKGDKLSGEICTVAAISGFGGIYGNRGASFPKTEITALSKFNLESDSVPASTMFNIKTDKAAIFGINENLSSESITANGKFYQNPNGSRLSLTLNSPRVTGMRGSGSTAIDKLSVTLEAVVTGGASYDIAADFNAAKFELGDAPVKLALKDAKIKADVKFTVDKNNSITFLNRNMKFFSQTLDYSSDGMAVSSDKINFNIKSEAGNGNIFSLNHIILANVEKTKLNFGNTAIESWGTKLESVFQPAAGGKRILRTKIDTGKTNIDSESVKAVAAAGNIILNSDFKPGLLLPDIVTGLYKFNSTWMQYGAAKIRAAEFKLRNKYFFDNRSGSAVELAKIETDFDMTELHGEINRLSYDAPALEGSAELRYTADSRLIPAAVIGNVAGKNITGNLDQNEFCLDTVNFNSSGKGDDEGNFLFVHNLKATGAAVKTNLFSIDLPILKLNGQSINSETFAGHLNAAEGTAEIPDYSIAAGGIEFKIPLALPDMRAAGNGEISVAKININKQNFGAARAELEFSDTGLIFQLNHTNKAIPGLSLSCLGQIFFPIEPFKLELDFSIPEFRLDKELQLQKILPGLNENVTLQGTLGGRGNLKIDGGAVVGNMDYSCRDAAIRREKLLLQNFSCSGTIEDIVNWRSAPHQNLKFKKLSFGEYELNNGSLNLELERPGVWLIENGQFDTLGGSCNLLAPFRLDETQGAEASVYCRSIALNNFLRFAGIDAAASSGKLDGTIAVKMNKEHCYAENFNLSSAPGESGSLIITNPEQYRSAGDQQAALFEQAVANCSYQWVKLSSIPDNNRKISLDAFSGGGAISGKLQP
jgi:hypothetical protein